MFLRVLEEKAEGLVVITNHGVRLGQLCGRAGVPCGGHGPVRLTSFTHPSETIATSGLRAGRPPRTFTFS
jgi:hypothetical protein